MPERLLHSRLAAWAGHDPHRAAVAATVQAIAQACSAIAGTVSMGPLAGDLGAEQGQNADGDTQKALDLLANERIHESLRIAPVQMLVSEEFEQPVELNADAPLVVAIDPLDGSSNIDTNVSVGTIFSVLPSLPVAADDRAASALQRGQRQVAAGYVIYGPHTALVLTLGAGTDVYTLEPRTGDFRLTREAIQIPETTLEFAINASNFRRWDGHIRAYVDDCLNGQEGPHGKNYNMRWIASLVAETHRILTRGGIFLYPADRRPGYGSGRLRLLYECNPVAMLVEQAGGLATTGQQRILEIDPTDIHQRAPLIFGSRREVLLVEQYYSGLHPINERSLLFGKRGLFRI